MKRTQCFYVIAVISFIILFYIYDNHSSEEEEEEEEERGGGGGGDSSLPFNFPHPPETIQEGLPYQYYQGDTIYGLCDGKCSRPMSLYEKQVLAEVGKVGRRNNDRLGNGVAFDGGRYRWLPDGLEHDLLYRDPGSNLARRVTLFQRLSEPQVVRSFQVENSKIIHIILTLKGRLDKYERFLHHLSTEILPSEPSLTLTVTFFRASELQTARNLTSGYFSNFPDFKWTLIPVANTPGSELGFSRGLGLHKGAVFIKGTTNGEVLFFSDVDVLPKLGFFSRCRANSILGRQIYYPIVFSLYNPELVYLLKEARIPSIEDQLVIGDDTGFWREFGYGMACMAIGDYKDTAGYVDSKTWGGEDEKMFEQFLGRENIKVIRAPDPDLFHVHHPKECRQTGDATFVSCLRSKANTEGSKLQLGMALLKLREGLDIEGVLSKRFYYFWLVPYLGGLLLLSLLTNALLATLLLLWTRRSTLSCKLM